LILNGGVGGILHSEGGRTSSHTTAPALSHTTLSVKCLAVDGGDVQMSLANANSSALVHNADKINSLYVVMPIKL